MEDESWIQVMKDELGQFEKNQVELLLNDLTTVP